VRGHPAMIHDRWLTPFSLW